MIKNFQDWHKIKEDIDGFRKSPFFREREIWWCSLGVNVGYEEDGKNEFFARPILILKKFNQEIFWGLPLTSQQKLGRFYYSFVFQNKESTVILSQLRILSGKRLIRRMGKINKDDFLIIKSKVFSLIKTNGPF